MSTHSQQRDQVGRIIEAEPVTKLLVTGVLVEQGWNPDTSHGDPEKPPPHPGVQCLSRLWPEEVDPCRGRQEETHPVAADDNKRVFRLKPREQSQHRGEVLAEKVNVEQPVLFDSSQLPTREVTVTKLCQGFKP